MHATLFKQKAVRAKKPQAKSPKPHARACYQEDPSKKEKNKQDNMMMIMKEIDEQRYD